MAASMIGRATKPLLTLKPGLVSQQAKMSTLRTSKGKKIAAAVAGLAVTGGAGLVYGLNQPVAASELLLHPPKLPWSHNGPMQSLDHASIRRGYQVYKQVCAACHSMTYLHYRDLIDVCFTEEDAKAEAVAVMIEDGPDDQGNMFQREGKLSDKFPKPYANDEAARAANAGALPPDLSFITRARHGGEDYIFHLLTGYCDPPAGRVLGEDQYYNPYFAGGAIGMTPPLYSEIIEYEDGTPATRSQLAKDVSTFLKWSAEREHDQRKRLGMKCVLLMGSMFLLSYYIKRHKWTVLKNRQIAFKQ